MIINHFKNIHAVSFLFLINSNYVGLRNTEMLQGFNATSLILGRDLGPDV